MPHSAARADVGGDREQARVVAEPFAHDAAVEQRFLRAEGLRHDDGGGALRIEPGEHALRGGAIDVGNEMDAEAAGFRRRQRIDDEPRPEIRSADADAHHIGDRRVLQRCRPRGACARARPVASSCAATTTGASLNALRNAVCNAARSSVGLTRLPSNRSRTRSGNCAVSASANNASIAARVVTLAREVGVDRTDAEREVGGARRIAGDQRADRRVAQARGVRAQGIEVLLEGAGVHAPQYHAACFGIE